MSRIEPLVLQVGDEKVLGEWTRASSISAGLAQRARILLLAAEGHSNTEIGRLVGVSLPTVRLWRGRYREGGVEALDDLPRSGRPAVHDETSIISVTLEPPPAKLGVTHWSARLLANHLGISFATVARIWRRWGLQPWKAETFKFSTDPVSTLTDTGVRGGHRSSSGSGPIQGQGSPRLGRSRAPARAPHRCERRS